MSNKFGCPKNLIHYTSEWQRFLVVILHLSYVYSRVRTTTSAEPWEVLSASFPAFLRILRQYFIIHLGHTIIFSIDSKPLCSRMASGTNLAAVRI
jgi:hypothetical protein